MLGIHFPAILQHPMLYGDGFGHINAVAASYRPLPLEVPQGMEYPEEPYLRMLTPWRRWY